MKATMSRFGRDEFMSKATDLSRTNYLTSDMSDLVNDCLHEARTGTDSI